MQTFHTLGTVKRRHLGATDSQPCLLGSTTMSRAFGVAGRDRAMACYQWNPVGAATVAVYEQVIRVDTKRMTSGVSG